MSLTELEPAGVETDWSRLYRVGGVAAGLLVVVTVHYFAVAPDRTPAFEMWGITLRIIQLPLFAALVYLALRAPESRHVHAHDPDSRRGEIS